MRKKYIILSFFVIFILIALIFAQDDSVGEEDKSLDSAGGGVNGPLERESVPQGFGPETTDFLGSQNVESIVIEQASIGDFCEVDLGTNECTTNRKSIIFGDVIIKYDLSKVDPTKQRYYEERGISLETYPIGLFILDNEIYIPFLGGYGDYYYPDASNTLSHILENELGINAELKHYSNVEDGELLIGNRLLPTGKDEKRIVVFNKKNWNEIYSIGIQYHRELIAPPNPKEGSNEGYYYGRVLDSVEIYKKYRLTAQTQLPKPVEVQVNVPTSPHVYIIEDDGTLVANPLQSNLVTTKFYEQYPNDNYDFIGIHYLNGAYGGTHAYKVQDAIQSGGIAGIVGTNVALPDGSIANRLATYGSEGRLLGGYVDSFDFNEVYVESHPDERPIELINDYYFLLLFHELTHMWGVILPVELQEALVFDGTNYLNSHWEFFTGSWVSVAPDTRMKFIERDGKYYFQVNCDAEPKHHDFDLYFMGLKSPNEITEKLVITAQSGGMPAGEICGTNMEVSNDIIRRVFSIQDMINVLGPRIPSSANSQKDFNIAFVMIVPEGQTLTQQQRDALHWIANKFPVAWYKSTERISTLNGIVPQDTTPPVISNVQVATTNSSITVSWNTNEPATGFVIYKPLNFYNSVIYPEVITNPPKFFTTHRITPENPHGLSMQNIFLWNPNSEYQIKIISIDENYNMASYDVSTVRTQP